MGATWTSRLQSVSLRQLAEVLEACAAPGLVAWENGEIARLNPAAEEWFAERMGDAPRELGELSSGVAAHARFTRDLERSGHAELALGSHRLLATLARVDQKDALFGLIGPPPVDAERLLDAVVDNVPVGVMVFDADGTLVRMNAAHKRFVGLPNYFDATGKINVLTDPIAPALRPAYQAAYSGAAASLTGQRLESSEVTQRLGISRAERYYDLVIFPLADGDGTVVNVVAFVVDATERTIAARDRERLVSRKAEQRRVDSLNTLAGGIAHDFNNALMTIVAETTIGNAATSLEGARSAFTRIGESAREMTDLVHKLLSYVGERPQRVGRSRPDEVADQVLLKLGHGAKANTDIAVELAAGEAVTSAEPAEIRQIVEGLASNALEALPETGGAISLRTSTARRDAQNLWVLEVSDDGSGMSAEVRARMFDPFFSTKSPGRGLGLSAVSGIVRRLGGDIEVSSERGEGSRVSLSLPCELEPKTAREQRAPGQPSEILRNLSVLLVDDDPILRKTLVRLLEVRGARVWAAGSCAEALSLLETQPIDAALLDVVMPGEDGWETLRRMRGAGFRAPILMMSGYTFDEVGEREGGSNGFLGKPFKLDELERALAVAFDQLTASA
jgi:two-component system cell cycle sensor histidine kinase/response regulator CckA